MSQVILFRVDASITIGFGHVMRCLTLARSFRKCGMECIFVCANQKGNLFDEISKEFECILLIKNTDKGNIDPIADAEQLIGLVKTRFIKVSLLVVDHYALDKYWEELLSPYAERIFVIDDLANRKHQCDFLLDQNYYKSLERYDTLVPKSTKTFLGPTFSILREEFSKLRGGLRRKPKPFKKILISYGGVDSYNFSLKSIKAVSSIQDRLFEINIVSGISNPHLDLLKLEIKAFKNVTLHIQANNMAELMKDADVCLGAGGATNWERLCLGLPSIIVSMAENQVNISQDLDADGLVYYLGSYEAVTENKIAKALLKFEQKNLKNPNFDKLMETVDGQGVKRIVNTVLKK